MSANKFRTAGWKAVDTFFKFRVQNPPGTDITQATTSSITYLVKEQIGPQQGATTGSGTLTVSSTVFNTLQTPSVDPSWTVDNTGYNFSGLLPASCFPDAGDYVVTFQVTPTGGGSAYPIVVYHHASSVS